MRKLFYLAQWFVRARFFLQTCSIADGTFYIGYM